MRPKALRVSHGRRLFFGFECRGDWLSVVVLQSAGTPVLRALFPLAVQNDTDLDAGPAAEIAATLKAFVEAHDAAPVCGTDHHPPVLEALAEHLGGPIRFVDFGDLERVALPGHDPLVRRELGIDAHQRAVLAGLAVADEEGLI